MKKVVFCRNTIVAYHDVNFKKALYNAFQTYLKFILVFTLLLPILLILSSASGATLINQNYINDLPKIGMKTIMPSGDYKLESDITATSSIVIDSGNVEIDLNGYNFTYNDNNLPLFEISNNANLIIKDSKNCGKVSNLNLCFSVNDGGTLIIENGVFQTIGSNPCIYIDETSFVIMNGGIVSSPEGISAIINDGSFIKNGGTVLSGTSEESSIDGNGDTSIPSPSNGKINIEVNTEYPSVNFSIDFPVIDNFSLLRSEDSLIDETDFSIKVNKIENLFDERLLNLSFESDFILTNSEDNSKSFPFTFEISDKTNKDFVERINLFIENQNTSLEGKIIIDRKDIPAKGTYQAEIAYIIEIDDK